MRDKSEGEKVATVSAYFSRDVKAEFIEKVITEWVLNENGRELKKVCVWLVNNHARARESDWMIHVFIEACFYLRNY